jgi:hypothetical protein
MLLRNAYPSWVLDRIIKCSVARFLQPRLEYGPKKERLYIGIPFLGNVTDQLRRSIKLINKQFLPHMDVIVYFKPGLRVSNFFHMRAPHHLSYDHMSFINIRALGAIPAIKAKRPDTYDIVSLNIMVRPTSQGR